MHISTFYLPLGHISSLLKNCHILIIVFTCSCSKPHTECHSIEGLFKDSQLADSSPASCTSCPKCLQCPVSISALVASCHSFQKPRLPSAYPKSLFFQNQCLKVWATVDHSCCFLNQNFDKIVSWRRGVETEKGEFGSWVISLNNSCNI